MKPVSFRELIHACPGHSLWRWLWFRFLRSLCLIWFKLFFRIRIEGREQVPLTGPLLIVSNHQSFFDPIIVGLAVKRRPVYSLARRSLFKPVIGWLIRSLNGIPVDRGSADLAAMRRCVEVLREGMGLAIYPEGTRTETGDVGTFKPGAMLLIKRAKPMVVPMAMHGAFEAWPRGRKLPRLFGRIRVRFAAPIPAEDLIALGDEGATARLEAQIRAMVTELGQPPVASH